MLTKIIATRQKMLIETLLNSGRASLHFSLALLHSEKHSGEQHGVCSLQTPCNALPQEATTSADLKQSRGGNCRRVKTRNNLHSTMCLTQCQKGLY